MEEELKRENKGYSPEKEELNSHLDQSLEKESEAELYQEKPHHHETDHREPVMIHQGKKPEHKEEHHQEKKDIFVEEKDDEEISIDFKKFFKRFKSKPKEKKPEHHHKKNIHHEHKKDEEPITHKSDYQSKENEEESISLDFSSIKNIFKKDKKKTESQPTSDDEVSLDLKQVTTFAKKNAKWLIPLFLILIPLIFSTYFRMAPASLPVTDDWAENQVYGYYQNQIANEINQQYPNLPQQNKDVLISKEFQKFLEENKEMVQQQLAGTSQQFKARLQDDNGQTYLLAIDPWYWFSEARNYLEYGQLGDSYNEAGERIFSLRNGREGRGITNIPLNSLFGAWLYKFLNFFNKDISLMGAFFLLPVIIIGLSLIPAFFVGRKIGGNLGGFFAAMIVAINTALLGRTPAGFSDTDPYNILFPLFITWMFVEAFEAKTTQKKIIYGSLGGFFSGLYSIAWLGYWYILGFVFATIAIYFLYHLILNFKSHKFNIISYFKIKQIKNTFIVGLTFFFSSALFVSLFSGINRFKFIFTAPFKTAAIKDVAVTKIWPNVLTTVAEFNTINLSGIIGQMGGNLLFWIALVGISLLLFNKKT
ncbi:MAG: hypothetical protein KJ597_05640, partial [Nanoarchaeota archaeon]|nr:hypothetical protein [Nanoarchaeota archaeon]